MKESGRLIIVGAKGLGCEAVWAANAMNAAGTAEWTILGFADDAPDLVGEERFGVPVVATSEDIADRFGTDVRVHIAIGANRTRGRIARTCGEQGLVPASLIHPRAEIAHGAKIGEGSYVGPFATLAPFCSVGRHVIVNIRAVVGHETTVGDFAQIAPGAVLTGGCSLAEGALVGSNASLYPCRRMGAFSTVASNSFVVADVPPEETVIGIPAKPVFRKK